MANMPFARVLYAPYAGRVSDVFMPLIIAQFPRAQNADRRRDVRAITGFTKVQL